MKIQQIKTSDLMPYFNNPRKNDDAVIKVAESIKAFGFQNPIIADKDMTIIAGHTRWKAALKLDLETVPVIVSDMPEEKARAYRIADNRLGEFAEWDWEKLEVELDEIDYELKDLLDFEINPDFEPVGIDEQGRLDELEPIWVKCPECGKEFNARES